MCTHCHPCMEPTPVVPCGRVPALERYPSARGHPAGATEALPAAVHPTSAPTAAPDPPARALPPDARADVLLRAGVHAFVEGLWRACGGRVGAWEGYFVIFLCHVSWLSVFCPGGLGVHVAACVDRAVPTWPRDSGAGARPEPIGSVLLVY